MGVLKLLMHRSSAVAAEVVTRNDPPRIVSIPPAIFAAGGASLPPKSEFTVELLAEDGADVVYIEYFIYPAEQSLSVNSRNGILQSSEHTDVYLPPGIYMVYYRLVQDYTTVMGQVFKTSWVNERSVAESKTYEVGEGHLFGAGVGVFPGLVVTTNHGESTLPGIWNDIVNSDRENGANWYSGTDEPPHIISFEWPYDVQLTRYKLWSRRSGNYARAPSTYWLEASADEVQWTVVDSRNTAIVISDADGNPSVDEIAHTENTIQNPGYYKYYRLVITEALSGVVYGPLTVIAQLALYGFLGDPAGTGTQFE